MNLLPLGSEKCGMDKWTPIGKIEHELTERCFAARREMAKHEKDTAEWHYWRGIADAYARAAQYAEKVEGEQYLAKHSMAEAMMIEIALAD